VGELSRLAAASFGPEARHFSSQDELIAALREELAAVQPQKVSVLIKGSRSAGMERVVAGLAPTPAGGI